MREKPMAFKVVIIIVLCVIVGVLGSGLVYMIRDKGRSNRTAKALTLRITLSLGLFVLLMVAYATGLITPHGIYPPAP
jgi:ABC-type siderophore export system fused ATPase/permease subunit